jgi:hypothetical protein
VAVIPIHIAELTNTFMTDTTVKLDDHPVLLIINIGQVGEAGPRLLSSALWQAVRTLDVAQISQLDRRFGSNANIEEQVAQ